MRDFLWGRGSINNGKSKVSWKVVCVPKYEGGLGIRRIKEMNKALMTSHAWSILTKRESLWVSWIHDNKLKGRSFWDIPVSSNCSWSWRKLLQLRPNIRNYIWSKVGNGKNTSVWFDRWSDICPIGNIISPREISRAGFSLSSSIADVISNGVWLWPNAWYDLFPVLINLPTLQVQSEKQDTLVWRDVDQKDYPYSSSTVWNSIRSKEQIVSWHKIVWNAYCIPRHAFNMWLIMRKRLLTQDVIISWSPPRRKFMDVMCCSLCIADLDSHEHLFFECAYASKVWLQVRDLAELQNVPPIWNIIIDTLAQIASSKSLINVIRKLLVAAVAYFIWQERNNRMFRNQNRPPDVLCKEIIHTIRLKLMGMTYKKTDRVSSILERWKVHGGSLFKNIS